MGNNLRILRESRNYTQEKVCNLLSNPENSKPLDKKTYRKWEYGEGSIPSDKLILLSDFYGVSIDYLLGRSEDTNIGNTEISKITGLSCESIEKLREYNGNKPKEYYIQKLKDAFGISHSPSESDASYQQREIFYNGETVLIDNYQEFAQARYNALMSNINDEQYPKLKARNKKRIHALNALIESEDKQGILHSIDNYINPTDPFEDNPRVHTFLSLRMKSGDEVTNLYDTFLQYTSEKDMMYGLDKLRKHFAGEEDEDDDD